MQVRTEHRERVGTWLTACRGATATRIHSMDIPPELATMLGDLFVFFQAEDGIRDYKVTGVQTCALPIFGHGARHRPGWHRPPRSSPRSCGQRVRRRYRPTGRPHPLRPWTNRDSDHWLRTRDRKSVV